MKIYLHEISDLETELSFTQNEKWVLDAVEATDEAGTEDHREKSAVPRPITVQFSLRKVDDVIVVDGRIQTHMRLICSRCANPFNFDCKPRFSALFCRDPVMAGVAHLHEAGKPTGQTKGFARHAHDESSDALAAQGKDLDITYLSHDYIDLSEVLREQLQFQVPFQPLCKETCKGICSTCGTDLNAGRCACAKIAKTNPFSVLGDLKVN